MILNYKSLEEKGMSEVIVITSGKGGVVSYSYKL